MWRWSLTYRKMPLTSHVHYSALQKSTKHSCVVRLIANLTSIGVLTPTYSRLSSQFLNAPLKLHKFLFCANDMNHCVGGTKCKYALDRLAISKIWLIQVKTISPKIKSNLLKK
jgi:hypothetical protein